MRGSHRRPRYTRSSCAGCLSTGRKGSRELARRRISVHLIGADDEFVLAITAQLERKDIPPHTLVGHTHPGSRQGRAGMRKLYANLMRLALRRGVLRQCRHLDGECDRKIKGKRGEEMFVRGVRVDCD